jgi:hypothetical protein
MGVTGRIDGRRTRRAVFAASAVTVVTATAAAATLAAATLAAGGSALAASSRPAARAGAELAAGQVGSRAAVPWGRVGPGWVLTEYWPGRSGLKTKAAPARLFLVDPAGGRYLLHRWAATKNPPRLIDWSGDKTRALLAVGAVGRTEQITLATGQVSPFRVPAQVTVIGYTRPDGLNVLGSRQTSSGQQLVRYNLNGQLQKVLGGGAAPAIYAPDGAAIAEGTDHGLSLISNAGGVIRRLPVPGTGRGGCSPARWWNSSTILATCSARGAVSRFRLWLVPASGSRPRALTPVRGVHSIDLGDLDAWRLRSGLYLQASGPCGSLVIYRQAANGSVRLVNVPHTAGNNQILTADGARLLIEAPVGCGIGSSLLWFDPATQRVNMLFRSGLLGEVPYGQPVARY